MSHNSNSIFAVGIAVGIVVIVLVGGSAAVRLMRYDRPPSTAIEPAGGVSVSGRILHDLRPSPGGVRNLTVQLLEVADSRGWCGTAEGRVTVFWRGEATLLTNDGTAGIMPLRGDILTFHAGADGWGDATAWIERDEATIQPSDGRSARVRRRLREGLQDRFVRLDRDSRALVLALLLGDRGSLDPGLYDDIRKSGGAHVLALSGMHLGILALLVRRLLRLFLSPRWALTVTLSVLIGYVWLAGWIPSLLRAMVLTTVVGVATLRCRSRPGIAHLLVTVVVFAVAAPHLLRDLGFQYSVLALTGLFLVYPRISSDLQWIVPRSVAMYLGSSLAAILATAPLSLALFGVVYPSGLLLAGVLTVLVTLVMWSGLVTAGIAFVPFMGSAAIGVTAVLTRTLSVAGSVGERVPALYSDNSSWTIGFCFLAVVAAVILLLRRRGRSIMKQRRALYSETWLDF